MPTPVIVQLMSRASTAPVSGWLSKWWLTREATFQLHTLKAVTGRLLRQSCKSVRPSGHFGIPNSSQAGLRIPKWPGYAHPEQGKLFVCLLTAASGPRWPIGLKLLHPMSRALDSQRFMQSMDCWPISQTPMSMGFPFACFLPSCGLSTIRHRQP